MNPTKPSGNIANEPKDKNPMPFQKRNYQIMIAGVLVLLLGFIIMSLDNEEFGFGVLGITIGPLVVLLGFAIQFFAIFYNPKKQSAE